MWWINNYGLMGFMKKNIYSKTKILSKKKARKQSEFFRIIKWRNETEVYRFETTQKSKIIKFFTSKNLIINYKKNN